MNEAAASFNHPQVGVYIFGIASIITGILNLALGEFEPTHQPLQTWGAHLPSITIFAHIAGVWLILGGAAIMYRASARFGALALATFYGIFVLVLLPRLYTAPNFFGYGIDVYIGALGSICEQLLLFVAATIVYTLSTRGSLSPRRSLITRLTFGLCLIDFGLAHLTATENMAPIVPKWMPSEGIFWAVLIGSAFVLAGLAIASGVLDTLAARLLAVTLLVFGVMVLMPPILITPREHVTWGAIAYHLTAVGAIWILADWLTGRQRMHDFQP